MDSLTILSLPNETISYICELLIEPPSRLLEECRFHSAFIQRENNRSLLWFSLTSKKISGVARRIIWRSVSIGSFCQTVLDPVCHLADSCIKRISRLTFDPVLPNLFRSISICSLLTSSPFLNASLAALLENSHLLREIKICHHHHSTKAATVAENLARAIASKKTLTRLDLEGIDWPAGCFFEFKLGKLRLSECGGEISSILQSQVGNPDLKKLMIENCWVIWNDGLNWEKIFEHVTELRVFDFGFGMLGFDRISGGHSGASKAMETVLEACQNSRLLQSLYLKSPYTLNDWIPKLTSNLSRCPLKTLKLRSVWCSSKASADLPVLLDMISKTFQNLQELWVVVDGRRFTSPWTMVPTPTTIKGITKAWNNLEDCARALEPLQKLERLTLNHLDQPLPSFSTPALNALYNRPSHVTINDLILGVIFNQGSLPDTWLDDLSKRLLIDQSLYPLTLSQFSPSLIVEERKKSIEFSTAAEGLLFSKHCPSLRTFSFWESNGIAEFEISRNSGTEIPSGTDSSVIDLDISEPFVPSIMVTPPLEETNVLSKAKEGLQLDGARARYNNSSLDSPLPSPTSECFSQRSRSGSLSEPSVTALSPSPSSSTLPSSLGFSGREASTSLSECSAKTFRDRSGISVSFKGWFLPPYSGSSY